MLTRHISGGKGNKNKNELLGPHQDKKKNKNKNKKTNKQTSTQQRKQSKKLKGNRQKGRRYLQMTYRIKGSIQNLSRSYQTQHPKKQIMH